MIPASPVSARIEDADGRVERVDERTARALYFSHRATVAPKRLDAYGGRNEFERDLQFEIVRRLAARERPGRLRAMLIGDSIRMRQSDATGYGLPACERLAEDVNLTHVPHNTCDSGLVLEHIDGWLACRPDIVHFNAGLHDLSTSPHTDVLPPWHHALPDYVGNLRRIVERLRAAQVRVIIWASSTPVLDAWHDTDVRTGRARRVRRTDADVVRYNEAAAGLMHGLGVPVNDLYATIVREGRERCLVADGVHLGRHGAAVLGRQVAERVRAAARTLADPAPDR